METKQINKEPFINLEGKSKLIYEKISKPKHDKFRIVRVFNNGFEVVGTVFSERDAIKRIQRGNTQ